MKIIHKMALRLVSSALLVGTSASVFAQKMPEERLDWKLGVQAFTFSSFTFEQTLDTLNKLGVKYVQAYSGQKLGGGIEGNFGPEMDDASRTNVLDMLKKKGITLYSFGVASATNEAEWRNLFEFVKAMGLSEFASEPAKTAIPLVAQLAKEYNVKVALHDHPRPAPYWSPDTLVKYTKGYTNYLGSCADIGHWVRSGIDPVEALKTLNKAGVSIFELHLKDLNEKPSAEFLAAQTAPRGGRPAVAPVGPTDVAWGTGIATIEGVLKELKKQKFKGGIFAEYESDIPANRIIQLNKSFMFFREKIKGL